MTRVAEATWYRILPWAKEMVVAHQCTNCFRLHNIWFGAQLGMSISNLLASDQPWHYHGVYRTDSHKQVHTLPKHECEPFTQSTVPEVVPVRPSIPNWNKEAKNLGIAHDNNSCSGHTLYSEKSMQPPWSVCSWVADIWAPKGTASEYNNTTFAPYYLFGCSFRHPDFVYGWWLHIDCTLYWTGICQFYLPMKCFARVWPHIH